MIVELGKTYTSRMGETRQVYAIVGREIHWRSSCGAGICSADSFKSWMRQVRANHPSLAYPDNYYDQQTRQQSITRLESMLPEFTPEARRRAAGTIENLRAQLRALEDESP